MRHNMSVNERFMRLIGGTALLVGGWLILSGYFAVSAGFAYVLSAIGVIVLATGILSWCPMYALFHHTTCAACKIGETHTHMPV